MNNIKQIKKGQKFITTKKIWYSDKCGLEFGRIQGQVTCVTSTNIFCKGNISNFKIDINRLDVSAIKLV